MKSAETRMIALVDKRGEVRFVYVSERHPLERATYDKLKKRGYDVEKIPADMIETETP